MRNYLIGCLSVIVLGLLGVIVLIGCRVIQERETQPVAPQPISAPAPTISFRFEIMRRALRPTLFTSTTSRKYHGP